MISLLENQLVLYHVIVDAPHTWFDFVRSQRSVERVCVMEDPSPICLFNSISSGTDIISIFTLQIARQFESLGFVEVPFTVF